MQDDTEMATISNIHFYERAVALVCMRRCEARAVHATCAYHENLKLPTKRCIRKQSRNAAILDCPIVLH